MQISLFENNWTIRKNTLVDIQKKSKNYNGLDKYYTDKNIAKYCISKIEFKNYDFIIEPSAGNGSFYNTIKHANKVGLDIEPENKNILKKDWFQYYIDGRYKTVLVIGNPPFGINNGLSVKFLQHCFRFSNIKTIAFILPDVYNKHTKQKIIPQNWRIKSIYKLPRNSFVYKNDPKHVPCSFFVFDKSKGKDLRFIPEDHKDTKDFYFGNKNNFDIFVFGASPQKITLKPKPNNRGYFLKSKIPIEELKVKIKSLPWQGNSCASGGIYWLTKSELCYQYKKNYAI